MPTTYNGVGTHYYGKKNKLSRTGICRQCGVEARLDSYDTRLWFVFVFIPVIPLGRKHIIDQCSKCSRHYATDVKAWELAKHAGISAAMDTFRSNPSDEAAASVHSQLVGFQQYDQAAELRPVVLEQFPQSALLRAKMAADLETFGQHEAAKTLWHQAFELDPEQTETKVGRARHHIRDGQLDQARQLLTFLEQPGAHQQYELGPIWELATAYQVAGQHEEALALMESLFKNVPEAAKDHGIRQVVRKSEKALHRTESILPTRDRSLQGLFSSQYSSGHRWAAGAAVALAVAAIGMAIANEYTKRHRALHIINACGTTANVQIDDQPPVAVVGYKVLTVREGPHAIRISGAVDEQHDVMVATEYFERWTQSPAWILNVGGEAVIADSIIHYAQNPPPPIERLHADTFTYVPDVDYAFETPPDTVHVDDRTDMIKKRCLSWSSVGPASDLGPFYELANEDRPAALSLAERKLRRDPRDERLLDGYIALCDVADLAQRAQPLLKSQLEHRPIPIHWHRVYQNLPTQQAHIADLIDEYTALLQTDPNNAALLYLRGRIDGDPDREREYMTKAVQADPSLHWPYRGLAYLATCDGQWQQALDFWGQAKRCGMDPIETRDAEHALKLALGQHAELEASYRQTLAESPGDLTAATLLVEVLAVDHDRPDATAPFQQATLAFRSMYGSGFEEVIGTQLATIEYILGNMQDCEQLCRSSPNRTRLLAYAVLADGRPDVFVSDALLEPIHADPWAALSCSVAFRIQGDSQQAEVWRQRASQAFETMGQIYEPVGAVLLEDDVSDQVLDRVRELLVQPHEKALLFAEIGLRSDTARDMAFAEAQHFLIRRVPSYHLVRKAIDAATPRP